MDRERFSELVAQAVEGLPEELAAMMENVDVVVEDHPTISQMRRMGMDRHHTLLGLYEGVPRTRRGSGYGLVLPDKITIFQQTIEAICHGDDEIKARIQSVVKHEIAHHFGISDARLKELEDDQE
ncbi:MAG: metallopeptidase family protein [Chloroflexota bacterium]